MTEKALSFDLTQDQVIKLKKWMKEHKCKKKYRKASIALYTYKFTPVGIGTIESVECKCGKIIGLTDVGTW